MWHPEILGERKDVRLTLLIGQYSQRRYLGDKAKSALSETVKDFRDHLPEFLPMPHPSPRNRLWLRRNPWFEEEVVPELRAHVREGVRLSRSLIRGGELFLR